MNKTARAPIALASAFAIAALLWGGSAAAEIYRYIDSDGEVHLVDDPNMIPPQYRAAALEDERARQGQGGGMNIVESPSSAPVQPAQPAARPGTPPAQGNAAAAEQYAGHDESWWRQQAQQKQRRIDELSAELDQVKADEEDGGEVYNVGRGHRAHRATPGHPGSPAKRAAVLDDDDDDEARTSEQVERELNSAKRDFDDFGERARRASVPPGWLR